MREPEWDLNCDLGEGEPPAHTAALMDWVDSANIACGGHAGDEPTIRLCLDLAVARGVRAGAHPGLPDRGAFGRGTASLDGFTPDDLAALLVDQVGALARIADRRGIPLHHVKIHGSLYHAVEARSDLARTYLRTVSHHWPGTRIYARAGGLVTAESAPLGVEVWPEGFLDRAYADDGTLVPRGQAGAVLHSIPEILERVRDLRTSARCRSIRGHWLPLSARTWCVHGDSPDAVGILREVRRVLDR